MSDQATVVMANQGGKKKIRWSFNQLIARMHRLNNQLIGVQLTTGNLVAVCLSAGQITAGVVALLWTRAQWFALLAVLICFPLAVAIERLSLGGLMICRTAVKELEEVEAAYHLKLLKLKKAGQEITEVEQYEKKRLTDRLKRYRNLAIPIIVMGILISGGVGDQIWQMVFQAAGGGMSVALSLSCAATISLTFVFSELFKEMADNGLVDLIQDDRIRRAVLAHEEQDIQVEIALQAFANFRSDPKKNDREVGKVERVIGSRITAFADYVEDRGLGVVQGVAGSKDVRQIEARAASKRRFEDCREDLEWLLQRNPQATLQLVAAKFGISRSTAKSWIDRVRIVEGGEQDQVGAVEQEVDVEEE